MGSGTCFVGSNLVGCDFSGANLTGVDFTGANMADTIFDETIIKDVILPNGQKISIDDPADSLSVMKHLTKPKQSKPQPVHVVASEKTEPKHVSPKDDLAMGREGASQSTQDHKRNIGRSR